MVEQLLVRRSWYLVLLRLVQMRIVVVVAPGAQEFLVNLMASAGLTLVFTPQDLLPCYYHNPKDWLE